MDSPLVVPTVGGARLAVDPSDPIGRAIATSGVWEPNVTAVFRAILSPGDVCVDVGAHVGYYTLLASGIVGSSGHVYALEPSPPLFRELCANIELNRASNVTALQAAAGAEKGDAIVAHPDPTNSGSSFVRCTGTADEGTGASRRVESAVPLRPVADVTRAEHRSLVRLVKIDVEGFEPEVVRGLFPLFAAGERPHLIVELHPESAEEAATLLARLSTAHDLAAYRIPKPDTYDRFSSYASVEPMALDSIRAGGYHNILLTPGELPPAIRMAVR